MTEDFQSSVRVRLEALREEEYKKFTAALIPGIDRDKMLGVRVPALRKLASELIRDNAPALPGYFEALGSDSLYEEKQLWGILLSKAKLDDSTRMAHYRNFVPAIDNWAVCDIACGTLPAAKKNPDLWMDFFLAYVARQEEFEIRFGVVMLLANFIDEEHIDQVLDTLAKVDHPAYYVTMAVGWTLAACYVRFPDKAENLLASGVLTKDIQNKTIQKIRESNSVSKSDKERMKGYKKL